jgi:L-serine dehydratase
LLTQLIEIFIISVFDMFKVGIGPSSSHIVGPMHAASLFAQQLKTKGKLVDVTHITTELYVSLGQTGKGHGTGKAVILGLLGYTPENAPIQQIDILLSEGTT